MSILGPAAVALVAGVISFTSPCCLPLMPGYLAYVSGVSAGDDGSAALRRRVVGAGALFVLGFAVVFTFLGASASLAGGFLLEHRPIIEKVGGAFVILMGLATMGALRLPFLYREARIDARRVRAGPAGAIPLGMAFAVGWTPCVGPVLASILAAAAATQTAWAGAGLLFLYSMGLGIPFLFLAWGQTSLRGPLRWLRRHGRGIELLGGSVLVVMGILMITGTWTQLFAPLLRLFARSGWPPI